MANIYRKSAMERLSSPEQLDKAIVIVSPSFWLSMLGAAGILIVALVWSIFGRLPQNVTSSGIFMNRDGIHSVYSEVEGTVQSIEVHTGDQVHKGEVIARLSSRKPEKKIDDLMKRRQAVEEVTLTSTNDTATDDNKAMLDLKSQGLTLDSDLVSDGYLLDARKKELAARKVKTAAAGTSLEELEIKYYMTLLPVDTNKANITFEETQTNYNTAREYLETAKASLRELDASNENTKRRYEEAKAALESASEDDADEYAALRSEYESAKAAWEDYEDKADDYEHSIRSWENVTSQTYGQYESAKNGYISQVVQQESTQAWNSQISAAYQRALSDYNTELAAQRELEDEVLQLEAKMAGEEDGIRKQNTALSAQFDAEKNAALAQIDREIKEYNEAIVDNSLTSTLEGTITEIAVVEGQVITAGEYVARVSEGGPLDNVVVCYVPVAEGRKVKVGMDASVYPSTTKKQEYGHMRGTVEYVDAYVTSSAEIKNQVGLDSVVDAFMKNGPVVEVRIKLEKDDSTMSGYWWSSKKGAEVELMKGTMVSAEIITEEKAPITMLIPYLKEKLTIRRVTDGTGSEGSTVNGHS